MANDIGAADIARFSHSAPFPDEGVSRASEAYLSRAVFVASACRRFRGCALRANGTAP